MMTRAAVHPVAWRVQCQGQREGRSKFLAKAVRRPGRGGCTLRQGPCLGVS